MKQSPPPNPSPPTFCEGKQEVGTVSKALVSLAEQYISRNTGSRHTFHWEGSLAARGAGVSWGHPVAQGGWAGSSQEGQTLGEACLFQGLAPAGTVSPEAV